MKQIFLLGMVGACVAAAIGYFGWMVIRAFYTVYSDWRLGHELDELEADTAARREHRTAENQARLNNGCEHVFENGPGAFPRRICSRCGIEADKPAGPCDHVWNRSTEGLPTSYCENCGKQLAGLVGIDASASPLS